MKRQEQRKNRE